MIYDPKMGSIYYMAFAGVSQKGIFKVKIERAPENHTFVEFEIVEFIFKNDEYSSKLGTTKNENLFHSFKDALKWFKEEADYTEQDIIVELFDRKRAIK